ncbi:hypothetical protein GINT2_000245 [Glugoides intestinalis]
MAQDDLNSWLKASAENRINAKNAWKATLIEHFVETNKSGQQGSVNFQRASCTLEGCMKVYSTRVDDVSENTQKLLEMFSKEEVKKKGNIKKKSNFIEKNMCNINLKEKDSQDYYDPVFASILLRNEDYFLLDAIDQTSEGMLLYSKGTSSIIMKDEPISIYIQQLPICDSLKDFEAVIGVQNTYSEPEFDINSITEPGIDFEDSNQNERGEVQAVEQENIQIFHETPFGYFKGWAGPSHWKVHIGKGNKKTTEKKQKQRVFIDFSEKIDSSLLEIKADTVLSKQAILERRKSKNLLPDDYSYEIKDLYKFIKMDGYFGIASETSNPKTWPEQCEIEDFEPANDDFNQNDADLSIQFEQSLILADKVHDQPTDQIQLKFTRIPKKIDIKRLKENVFHMLNRNINKFSQIISQVPGVYSEKEGKDITPHFCLISLLHLANEQGLEIKHINDDLLISGP